MTSDSITKLSIDQLYVGMTESISKVITSEDVRKFSELSGDTNPIHLDEQYAKETRYKKNIAHGLMCASYFSGIFGTKLPSITSMCIQSALLLFSIEISFAKFPKSADKIEGATIVDIPKKLTQISF